MIGVSYYFSDKLQACHLAMAANERRWLVYEAQFQAWQRYGQLYNEMVKAYRLAKPVDPGPPPTYEPLQVEEIVAFNHACQHLTTSAMNFEAGRMCVAIVHGA